MTKAELYYQIALAQFQEQHRRSAGFDARAGSIMAVAATLAGIGAVILKSFSGQTTVPPGAIVVTALLGLSFLGVALHGIKGMRPQAWSISPDPNDLAKHLHSPDYEEAGLTEWIGDRLAESVTHNEKLLRAKGEAVIWATRCVVAMAALLLVLAVFVNVGI